MRVRRARFRFVQSGTGLRLPDVRFPRLGESAVESAQRFRSSSQAASAEGRLRRPLVARRSSGSVGLPGYCRSSGAEASST
jgi:hypothetical protein